MWKKIEAVWLALPPRLRVWLKGAEVAVVTAVLASCVAAPVADFRTKKGVSEFAAGVLAAAYGALRLYVAQSPLPVAAKVSNPAFTFNVPRSVVQGALNAEGEIGGCTTVVQTSSAGRGCDGETKIGTSGLGYDTSPKITQGESK